MDDPSGTTTFGYDDASRQTLVVFPGGKRVTYTFDDGGRRATLVDPDSLTATYSFDNANRLTGLVNGASERTTWAYDSAGRLTTLTLANNATVTYAYDSASRISGVRNAKSDGTAISGFAYTRDNVGNPTAVTLANVLRYAARPAATQDDRLMTFTYDDSHRPTREQRSGTNAYDMTYTFDAVGNRTTKLTGGVTTTFTYNEADQVTVQNAGGTLTTFSFDAAGNNTVVNAAGTRTTYTWDLAERLTGIALSGGALITVAYCATGLRRTRQDGSGTVKYLWDGQAPLMETDGDGTTTARYTGAPDTYGLLVSQRRGNASRFFHPNDLGTFDTVTDADAATTDTYVLDAWGVQHAATGSTVNAFRYIGALGYYTEPDLGVHYVRARWLRPATGSWLTVDPVETRMRYGYGRLRPTGLVDPGGLLPGTFDCAICAIACGVLIALAAVACLTCIAGVEPASKVLACGKCFPYAYAAYRACWHEARRACEEEEAEHPAKPCRPDCPPGDPPLGFVYVRIYVGKGEYKWMLMPQREEPVVPPAKPGGPSELPK